MTDWKISTRALEAMQNRWMERVDRRGTPREHVLALLEAVHADGMVVVDQAWAERATAALDSQSIERDLRAAANLMPPLVGTPTEQAMAWHRQTSTPIPDRAPPEPLTLEERMEALEARLASVERVARRAGDLALGDQAPGR